jgi:hypothetical protein
LFAPHGGGTLPLVTGRELVERPSPSTTSSARVLHDARLERAADVTADNVVRSVEPPAPDEARREKSGAGDDGRRRRYKDHPAWLAEVMRYFK